MLVLMAYKVLRGFLVLKEVPVFPVLLVQTVQTVQTVLMVLSVLLVYLGQFGILEQEHPQVD